MRTDRDLLQQALEGNANAFEALVERHFGLAYTVAYARLRDPETAEDLTQEVMLRAYLHLERLGPGGNFPAWVARIARNLAIDWLRRGQRASRLLSQVPLGEAALRAPDPTAKGAREIMAKREESDALRTVLFDLPEADRELVLLHFTEGLSQSDIADRLGTTQATISRRLKAALGKLRGQLEPMLREVGPSLRVPQRAVVRSVAFIAAASALSATAKASLVAAVPASEIASATSAAKAGAVGAVGILGLLQSLPALIAGGAKAMATGKGIAAAVVAAGAITAGGVYLGTHADHESSALLPPPTEGVSALDSEGHWLRLPSYTYEEMERLEDRMQAGEDAAALFAELHLPQISREMQLRINLPDMMTDFSLESADIFRGFDIDQIVLEDLSTPSLGAQWREDPDSLGTWIATASGSAVGDVLGIFWESPDRSQRRAWLAAFAGAAPEFSRPPLPPVRPWRDLPIADIVRLERGISPPVPVGTGRRVRVVCPPGFGDLEEFQIGIQQNFITFDLQPDGSLENLVEGATTGSLQFTLLEQEPLLCLASGQYTDEGLVFQFLLDQSPSYFTRVDDLTAQRDRGELNQGQWGHRRDLVIQSMWPDLGWRESALAWFLHPQATPELACRALFNSAISGSNGLPWSLFFTPEELEDLTRTDPLFRNSPPPEDLWEARREAVVQLGRDLDWMVGAAYGGMSQATPGPPGGVESLVDVHVDVWIHGQPRTVLIPRMLRLNDRWGFVEGPQIRDQLSGTAPVAAPAPTEGGPSQLSVFAVSPGGAMTEIPPIPHQQMIQMMGRFQAGGDPAALLSEMDLVSVPRSARLIADVNLGGFMIQQLSFAEMTQMAPTVDRSLPGGSLPFVHTMRHEARRFPGQAGMMELALAEPPTGDLLIIVRVSPGPEIMRLALLTDQ